MPESQRATSEHFEVWTARCSHAWAETLLRFDHHYVWIAGRAGVLLTYPWMELAALGADLLLSVVFSDVATRHPPAPRAIQKLVDQLVFEPSADAGSRRPDDTP